MVFLGDKPKSNLHCSLKGSLISLWKSAGRFERALREWNSARFSLQVEVSKENAGVGRGQTLGAWEAAHWELEFILSAMGSHLTLAL